jgi:hypothetical protein
VTYDFGWSPYAEELWGPAGPFLDLLCCHCAGYRLARETPLSDWQKWIRANEQVSDIFYASGRHTVGDVIAHGQMEALQRETMPLASGDLKLAEFESRSPEAAAADFRSKDPDETNRQALRILSAMFRLTRFYGADAVSPGPLQADARTLLLAVRSQLHGWKPDPLSKELAGRFERELSWFLQPWKPMAAPLPAVPYDKAKVQRGVVTAHDAGGEPISHGAMLYFSVRPEKGSGAAAMKALSSLALASEADALAEGEIFRNLGFTYEGMVRLGLPASILAAMPDAFAEGAEARAPQVGDLHAFHPRTWAGLPGNWPLGQKKPLMVPVAAVDVVIQLRIRAGDKPKALEDPGFPLAAEIARLAGLAGLKLLSVEALAPANPDVKDSDHLGFVDGVSQPVIDGKPPKVGTDSVTADALLADPKGIKELEGGSFLAVRRMPIDRRGFEKWLAVQAKPHGMTAQALAEKLMGRGRNGVSPMLPGPGNVFTYTGDPGGKLCPRQSHVRRANPREGHVPRIMRRGMSFHTDKATGDDNGNMFMAYCGDLATQYEVVLAWVNGGNSSRIGSWAGDPICGVRPQGKGTVVRLLNNGVPVRVTLPPAEQAYVKLSWSLYLYAPPLPLVRMLEDFAERAEANAQAAERAETLRLAAVGDRVIRGLQAQGAQAPQWRRVLDEPGARSEQVQRAIWTAIRHRHGGQLATPAGHLVATHGLVLEVLRDDGQRFSVREAGRRMRQSLGKMHLGMDAYTADYRREAPTCNGALEAIKEPEAFDLAYGITRMLLNGMVSAAKALPVPIDLVRDLLEPVTAAMAPHWFGLPDGTKIKPGASDWRDIRTRDDVFFPGDAWNSSRFAFNPFTSAETERLSALHGQALVQQATEWVKHMKRTVVTAPVAAKLFADNTNYPTEADVGRVLTGAMMGWVATTLGNGARIFDAWLTNGNMARWRPVWLEQGAKDHATADGLFGRELAKTLALAPVPENKHRVVAESGAMLGGQLLAPGTFVVVGLESAAADQQERGVVDSYVPFGMAGPKERQTPHGCPGRKLALGHLLGMLAASMEAVDMRHAGGRFTAELRP